MATAHSIGMMHCDGSAIGIESIRVGHPVQNTLATKKCDFLRQSNMLACLQEQIGITNNYNHCFVPQRMSITTHDVAGIFPGDKIASIEEYESGANTFDDGDMVRAATIGEKTIDKKTRIASIKHPKMLSVPKKDDIIIGTVAAVMSSMIAVGIDYINGASTTSKVECICSTRNIRRKNIALEGDVVMLRILSRLNGTIHGTMNAPELGVVFTKCRKCGGAVVPLRDVIKCTECSWIDERKLSNKLNNSDFISNDGKFLDSVPEITKAG